MYEELVKTLRSDCLLYMFADKMIAAHFETAANAIEDLKKQLDRYDDYIKLNGEVIERLTKKVKELKGNEGIDMEVTDKEATEICKDALYHYGISNQTSKAIEEMSELTKEICKWKEGADNKAQIIEEMTDVYIMLKQMVIYFDCLTEIYQMRNKKLKRLKTRIFEEENP